MKTRLTSHRFKATGIAKPKRSLAFGTRKAITESTAFTLLFVRSMAALLSTHLEKLGTLQRVRLSGAPDAKTNKERRDDEPQD
jgi:hypothetical protein